MIESMKLYLVETTSRDVRRMKSVHDSLEEAVDVAIETKKLLADSNSHGIKVEVCEWMTEDGSTRLVHSE